MNDAASFCVIILLRTSLISPVQVVLLQEVVVMRLKSTSYYSVLNFVLLRSSSIIKSDPFASHYYYYSISIRRKMHATEKHFVVFPINSCLKEPIGSVLGPDGQSGLLRF